MKEFNQAKKKLRELLKDKIQYKTMLMTLLKDEIRTSKFLDSFAVYFELENQGEWWTEFHENMSLTDFETVYGNVIGEIHVMKVVAYHYHNLDEIAELKYNYELHKAKESYREAYVKLLSNSRFGKNKTYETVTEGDLPF